MAENAEGGAKAYDNPMVNTVLVPSPLAHAFDYASQQLNAPEIDVCKGYLECFRPEELSGFRKLNRAQQDLILDIKGKEGALSDIFLEVVGQGAFIDVSRYVPSRRSVMRTAIPHIDQCDSHMTGTIIGERGTLLYLRGFEGLKDQDFKSGHVKINDNDMIEASPTHLCFIKGTDHPDIINNDDLTSRWHGSPIITNPNEARLGNFFAMRNGASAQSGFHICP